MSEPRQHEPNQGEIWFRRILVIFVIVVGIFLCGIAVPYVTGPDYIPGVTEPPRPTPVPEPREPWAGWSILGYLVILALAALIVMGVGYLFGRLWYSIQLQRAQVRDAHLKARQVHADENGLFPAVILEMRETLANLNAAAAGLVVGPQAKSPHMPDPQSDDQRAAAARSSTVQLAAAATGKGGMSSGAGQMMAAGMGATPNKRELPEVRELDSGTVDKYLEDGRE